MINWIKFTPLRLRDHDGSLEFNGPDFSKSKSSVLNIGGNKLSFRAPRHRSSSVESIFYKKNKEVLTTHFDYFGSGITANDNWRYNVIFRRSWDYYRPWFCGAAGSLSMSVSILTRTEGKAFQGASFFHPRSFEYALTNFLHVLYGFKSNSKGKALYQAPVNWTPCAKIPVVSVLFNIEPINRKLIFSFPISDTHIVQFIFSYIAAESEAEKQHMEKLAHDIIDSVKLELTSETQAKVDAIAKECGDMRLTENFPPLKWPIKPEDIEDPRNDQPLPEGLGFFGDI